MPTSQQPKPDSMPLSEVYVYVLPAYDEDILKIGFSRDPLVRMRAFHPRYYEWFALDEGFLLSLPSEREARNVELVLARHVRVHRSRSPAAIRRAAGGHTEWYRGALPILREFSREQAEELGVSVVVPVKEWLSERLNRDRAELYEWSLQLFDALTLVTLDEQHRLSSALRDVLDAYTYFGIDVRQQIPSEVFSWWKNNDGDEIRLA